jgi:tetratricopeptide (TPR) repeat protein
MSDMWYYNRGSKERGPIPGSKLKALVDRGEVAPTDLVWKDDDARRVEARNIKGLFPVSSLSPTLPQRITEQKPPALRTDAAPIVDEVSLAKAEHNHLQATFKLHECQAHFQVYGDRLPNVANDGMEFIEAALRTCPNSPGYWNTKALLLTDGLGDHRRAMDCLKRALELEPDSIIVKQNIRNVEQSTKGCFGLAFVALAITTAGIGTPLFIFFTQI